MTAIVHNASPGLWRLAWRRLRADRVAMASLAVVAAFLLMLVLSASGLIVADWEREVGVNYAPPGFAGAAPAM
ncbi:ABC transporter permease, partial [Rugamonas sp. FT81W]|nr:ABC transporter permease [Duganella vulcania]